VDEAKRRTILDPKPETAVATTELPRRIIKRYSNRKLYDTKDSRYVTLLQIAEMVRSGEEVQIIDNNTKDDLTEVTLAQIIY
jgi:polyhydroxyalkanoate synthesis regulator protein